MEPSQSGARADVAVLLLRFHQLEKGLAASAGLSVDEFHCLGQLYTHAPCCVKVLCEALGIHPTRASRLINDLEKRGYLTRSLGFPDKRKELLTLTPEGTAAARSVLESSTLSMHNLARMLPTGSAKLLVSELAQLDGEEEAI